MCGQRLVHLGHPGRRWNDDEINTLKTVPGSAFEVVEMGTVVTP